MRKVLFASVLLSVFVLSCSKKEEGGAKSPDIRYTLETVDGVILEDTLATPPSVTLTITSGRSDLYDISYTVDDGRETYLRNVAVFVPARLECDETEGSHSVSGTIEGDDGETCRFSCTYKVTREDDVHKSYSEPEVTLITDTIPASGGTVKDGKVTYRQKCVTTDGKDSVVTWITSGGKVAFGDSVSAGSRGCIETLGPTYIGTLKVSVTMNGKTGWGSSDVHQEANRRIGLELTMGKTALRIGEQTSIMPYGVFTSGARQETPGVTYAVTPNGAVTISKPLMTVTGNKCGTDGTDATVTVSLDGLSASGKVIVDPYCTSITYGGPHSISEKDGAVTYKVGTQLRLLAGGSATYYDATNDPRLSISGDGFHVDVSGGKVSFVSPGTDNVTFSFLNASITEYITGTSY